MTSCLWCSNEATRLCDAALGGRAATGMKGRWVYEKEVFTCDAPMCPSHSKVVGFICGKDSDLIEHCPYCVTNEQAFGPMFDSEADALRRSRHAIVRRSMMRTADQVGEGR